MADFSARPLGILDRVYAFVGGLRGVSDFDLGGAIQPVHDVAPAAIESASRQAVTADPMQSGIIAIDVPVVHAGAGTAFGSLAINPASLADPSIGINQAVDLELVACTCHNGATAPSLSMAAIIFPVPGATGDVFVPVLYSALNGQITATDFIVAVSASGILTFLPIRVPRDFTLVVRSTATAAGTATFSFVFRVKISPT